LQPDKAGSAPAFRVSHLRAPAEAQMSDNLESLHDLVETRAATCGIPRRYLWEWARIAIRDGVLPYSLTGEWKKAATSPFLYDDASKAASDPLPSEHLPSEHDDRAVRERARSELGDNYDPFQSWWWKQLMIAPAVFDEWLKGRQSLSRPKRREGRKLTSRDAVKAHIDEHYSGELPPNVTYVQVARDLGVSERTVRRALGLK
jgi:hypothetical protein